MKHMLAYVSIPLVALILVFLVAAVVGRGFRVGYRPRE